MKKLKYLLISFVAIISAAAFISCSSDDEEKETEVKERSQFQYTFTINSDILEIADVTINYIDTDNEEHSEAMTSTTWTKTLTADKFDVAAGAVITIKKKSDIELSKESYDLDYSIGCNISSTKNEGIVDYKQLSTTLGLSGVSKDNVELLLNDLNSGMAFKIDSEGQISSTSLSWQDNFDRLWPYKTDDE